MIIDPHVHVLDKGHWPKEWWDWVARDWANRVPGRKPEDIVEKAEENLLDPDGGRLISQMDSAGVDVSVILPIDWGVDYHAARTLDEINQHAEAVARLHSDRLIAFAGIDPRREGASDKLERWLSGSFKGLKLYPSTGFYPASAEAFALYEVCAARDMPVLFHTGDPLPVMDKEYARPKHFAAVTKAFPRLKIFLAHCGYGQTDEWNDALEVAAQSERACLELSVLLWDDSTEEKEVELVRKIDQARNRVGIERILFGTDHVSGKKIRPPGFLDKVVSMFRRLPDTARKAGVSITAAEHDKIMGGNVQQLINVDWSRFRQTS
ncbi:amidohydrolase family protein [Bradyrhizobium sp. Pear77]|uniref:amidohydrolase family protein n=1 Tax=Bradyrhizobium TaxID=374 RepID=UPI00289AD259|nr:amidohydrolase family protein [Bradyrhizobium altum]MCC8958125.1 amidohydrolase family protein [Bradyrhizobium altum]MCC8967166.1 amidohydrolase family protein [Bradyrhizobium oropedii]